MVAPTGSLAISISFRRGLVAAALGAAMLASPLAAAPASATAGDVILVPSPTGAVPSSRFDMSGDGRYIATISSLQVSPYTVSLMVYDAESGETEPVVPPGLAGQLNPNIAGPSISDDGRFVSFVSDSPDLVPGDTNGTWDVFVYDRESDTTTRASTTSGGMEANAGTFAQQLSGDGTHVAFASAAANLVGGDTNNASDVFVKNLVTGELVRASNAMNGTAASGTSPAISDDGQAVVFDSTGSNLVADDTNNYQDIFVADLEADTLVRASVSASGAQSAAYHLYPAISGNGRFVTFTSGSSTLVPGVAPPALDYTQVFHKDLVTGEIELASAGWEGGIGDSLTFYSSLSDDGRFVAFQSYAQNLVPHAVVFDRTSIFVRDIVRNTTSVGLRGVGFTTANLQSGNPVISSDGRLVTSWSQATNLVPEAPTSAIYRYDRGGVDEVSPTVTLDSGPQDPTGDTTPTFAFSSADGGVDFECSLAPAGEAGDYEPCSSPVTFAAQAAGPYTFMVRVSDLSGNTSQAQAETFTIDDSGVTASITSAPDVASADNTPTFEFSSPDPSATFQCALAAESPSYEACESPLTYPAQPDGTTTFWVRALDQWGNVGSHTTHTFTIDTAGPAVTIDGAPEDPTTDNTPTFSFSTQEAGAAFECSLSTGVASYEPCTSPITYPAQPDGVYTFMVRGVDALSNQGPEETRSLAIDAVQITSPSAPDLTSSSDTGLSSTDNLTSDTTPTFAGTATAGNTVTIVVDGVARGSSTVTGGGAYSVTTSALSRGTHQIAAVGSDGGATSQPSPILTVEIVAPTACHTATNIINGTAANNTLNGARFADRISGLGGNDVINGRAAGDCLVGGTGTDELAGAAGNDELRGDDGNDELSLGGGADLALGGAGNDRVFARDNVADQIDCGAGTADIANVDALDVVVNCETVRRG